MAKSNLKSLLIPMPHEGHVTESARFEQPPRSTVNVSNYWPYGRDGRQQPETRPGLGIVASGLPSFADYSSFNKEVQAQIQTSYYISGVKYTVHVVVVYGRILVSDDRVTYTAMGAPTAYLNTTGKVQICAGISKSQADSTLVHSVVIFTDGTNTKSLDLNILGAAPGFAGAATAVTTLATGTGRTGTAPTTRALCCIWRNRLVLAGPNQNWHMSRVGDYFDFNYGAVVSDITRAIADTNAQSVIPGGIADSIIALIPQSDDRLLIAGDRMLYCLNGDPAAGGQIQAPCIFSILGPNAWCMDPTGLLWIAGTTGLYHYYSGLELNSGGKQTPFFAALNRTSYYVNLAWDMDKQACCIFVCDTAATTGAVSLRYDRRTNSYWPFTLSLQHGPVSVLVWDSDTPADRTIMLGGRHNANLSPDNGDRVACYSFRNDKSDDDLATVAPTSQAISSQIFLGPFRPIPGKESKVITLSVVLGEAPSGYAANTLNATWAVYAGSTPKEAYDATGGSATGTFTSYGQQADVAMRLTGQDFYLVLSNSTAGKITNLEEAYLEYMEAGRVR